MSYQVIARKWRPQTFEEITGQEHITQTLRNALEYDRLHHAYLFSGARGVGKTTTARLLAKALNCHKTDKPNLHPCSINNPDPCPSCIEISESRSMDVLEIDAASHTGIDDVRDTIIEGISINPARDRYKVFIIDEIHQLSKPAFNALLKTLEEPPPNVVFIMATTELHKVPDTILSRCQEFEFRTIPLSKIFDRLKIIAKAEKIGIEDNALREIARSGMGSMRDAQSNFDQVISFSGEEIKVADVVNALGFASVEMLTRVLDAVVTQQSKGVLAVVEELSARGQDFRNFCRDLLGLFRDLLVAKVAGETEGLYEAAILDGPSLKKHGESFTESDLIRFFHSLAETETKLKEATQSRYVLEIGLVKLIEMRRVAPVEKLIERLAALEASLGGGEVPPKAAAAPKSTPAETLPEKKTLNPEETFESVSADIVIAPEAMPAPVIKEEPAATSIKIDLDFVNSIPVKLPPISDEELEHAEDAWLDDAYEQRLSQNGDSLAPIGNADKLVDQLLGRRDESGATARSSTSSGTASAAMQALERPDIMPVYETENQPSELPVLSDNPTEKELFAYAQAHPTVKKALRVFRAKIIDVKKLK